MTFLLRCRKATSVGDGCNDHSVVVMVIIIVIVTIRAEGCLLARMRHGDALDHPAAPWNRGRVRSLQHALQLDGFCEDVLGVDGGAAGFIRAEPRG